MRTILYFNSLAGSQTLNSVGICQGGTLLNGGTIDSSPNPPIFLGSNGQFKTPGDCVQSYVLETLYNYSGTPVNNSDNIRVAINNQNGANISIGYWNLTVIKMS